MIKSFKIWGFNITWVFRHRWEPVTNWVERHRHNMMWKEWKLGFFYKCNQVVGTKDFHTPQEWGNNLVSQYRIGTDLLICKTWFTVDRGVMQLEID